MQAYAVDQRRGVGHRHDHGALHAAVPQEAEDGVQARRRTLDNSDVLDLDPGLITPILLEAGDGLPGVDVAEGVGIPEPVQAIRHVEGERYTRGWPEEGRVLYTSIGQKGFRGSQ